MNRSLPIAFLFFATVAGGGCNPGEVGDDGVAPTQQAVRVTPTGDELAGSIQVDLPTGISVPSTSASLSYRGTAISIGTPTRFAAGTGNLVLSSPYLAAGNGNTEPNIAIVQKQNTVFKLAAIKPSWNASAATSTLSIDFGPQPRLTGKRLVGGSTWTSIFEQGPQTWDSTGSTPVVVLPGDYSFNWNLKVLDPITFTLAQGEAKAVSFTPPDRRTTIKVAQPQRDFPHAKSPTYPHCTVNTGYLVQRNRDMPYAGGPGYSTSASEGVVAFRAHTDAPGTQYRVFPFDASEAPMHYEFVVNNIQYRIDAKPGAVITVPVDRIDVDDVRVTNERGEVTTVAGTYNLYRRNTSGDWEPVSVWDRQMNCGNVSSYFWGPFPTRTGIDVLPGTYKIVTYYSTLEGSKKTEQLVTIP